MTISPPARAPFSRLVLAGIAGFAVGLLGGLIGLGGAEFRLPLLIGVFGFPALEAVIRVPAMRDKGRLRVGADADITVFDPNRITDRATYRDPSTPSTGIQFVIVNGSVVAANGRIRKGVAPGRPIRAPVRN